MGESYQKKCKFNTISLGSSSSPGTGRTTSSSNPTTNQNHLKQEEDGFSSTASTGKTASMSGPPGGGGGEEKSPTSPASLPREIVTRTNCSLQARESLGTQGDPIALDDSSSDEDNNSSDDEQQDTQAAATSERKAPHVDKKGSKGGVSINGDTSARQDRASHSQKDKVDRDQRGVHDPPLLESRETKDKLLEVGSPVYAPCRSNQPDENYYWGIITAKFENDQGQAIFNITFFDGDELNGVGSAYIHRMKEAFQLKERETIEVDKAPKEYFNLWRPEDGPSPDWNHFKGLRAGEPPKKASPKQQQLDVTFRRPKGRASKGEEWDKCKGGWVKEKTSKKRAFSPMENSVTRKDAGSDTLQKTTTKQTTITSTFKQKDGTCCQTKTRPPLGKIGDKQKEVRVTEKASKKCQASPMENSITRKDAGSGTLQKTTTKQTYITSTFKPKNGTCCQTKTRPPLGKIGDKQKEVRVTEKASKKCQASPMENSITRKDAGSGTLQKTTTKQTYITSTFKPKNGTCCQTKTRPPLGKIGDKQKEVRVTEKASKKCQASPMENSVTTGRKDAGSGTLQKTAINQSVPRQSSRQRSKKRLRLADYPLVGQPYQRIWIRANFQQVSIAGTITEGDDDEEEYSITYSSASLEMLKSGISGAPGILSEPEVKAGIDMVWDGCLRAFGENLPEELVELKPGTIERWLVPSTIAPDMIVADDIQIPGFLYLPVLRLTYNGYCLKLRVGKSSIEGARFGLFLSVRKEFDSDHCEDDFILQPGELIDLGVYSPLRVEDVKSNIEFLAKTLIHKFKPEVFVWGTDRKETSSKEAYFDATDDLTGELHMLARRRVYPFVNEIADPKTKLPIITSRMDPEGALHYLLGPSHKAKGRSFKVAADGSEREVFTDYEDLYENMRILEGYPRDTLDSKEARDGQLLKMEYEYVEAISGKCEAEDMLRVVRTFRPFMSPTYDMPKDTVVRTIAIFVLMKHISCRLLSQCNDRGNRSQLDDFHKECDSGIQEGSECLKLQHGTGVNLLHEARQSSLFKCIFERVYPRYQLSSLDETAFTGLLLSITY